MQSVPREWLDFLRQQFPKDSRIQLTEIGGNPRPISPGSTGKLDYIDDAGQFHVKWDNGCTLALVLGEDGFSVYLPEPQTFKLYMPLTADFYGRDEWGDMSEDGEEWDGHTLMDYEGQILINGTDIREWGPGRIAGFFSIVYQDFARYGLSLYENIAIGDVEKLCGDEINLVRFQDVVDMMELGEIVSDLKHGMETKLGKIVRDSEDLSGGQWQRVAIARCLVSDRPVKILDEPTAALDPAAESALYEKFRTINQKYTSVTISHRLASARQTDVIFVIENGRVSGSGSHETLYRENRLYREMYDSQRSWYQG